MTNDRGIKKWTSIMLPEHVEMLEEYWKSTEHKVKPIVDEHLKSEINLLLQLALEKDLTIKIEYFKDHDYHSLTGKLVGADPLLNYVRIDDVEKPLDSLTGAMIDE